MSNFFKYFGLLAFIFLTSIAIFFVNTELSSSYLNKLVENDYSTIIITLFGFNIAIQTIALGQLQEIESYIKKHGHFKNTRSELKQNIFLNLILVILSFFVLIGKNSQIDLIKTNNLILGTFDILLVAILVTTLLLLYETITVIYKSLNSN